MRETNFQVFIPIDLKKAGPDENGQWRIGGIAATEAEDLDGDNVIMKGLDTSYLESGRAHFNWNHGNRPEDIVGEIDIFNKGSKKLYVEGFLYKGVDQAEKIFKLMKAMAQGSKRKLGFSVEGKIRQREDNKILKSWVKAVAITHEPVNPYTVADLVKSLSGIPSGNNDGAPDFGGELFFHNKSSDEVWQLIPPGACVLNKALAAGHSPAEGGLTIVPESLEHDKEKEKEKEKDEDEEIKKSMSYEESIFYLQEQTGADFESAKNILSYTEEFNKMKGELNGVH